MIGLRSRDLAVTESLSAFVQSVGYGLAAGGPILVGALLGVSDTWTWPLTSMIIALACQLPAHSMRAVQHASTTS